MLSIFDGLRDFTLLSVAVRMVLAVICGGIIGMERALRRRPAGFQPSHLIAGTGNWQETLAQLRLFHCKGQRVRHMDGHLL